MNDVKIEKEKKITLLSSIKKQHLAEEWRTKRGKEFGEKKDSNRTEGERRRK